MAAKAFPLPAHHLRGQSDLGNPLAEIPSQPGDLEPDRVAPKLRHRHAPSRDPLAKLFNDIFLVAPLIGKIDDLASRVRARQIGQHQPVTEMCKERPLPISLFDQNPPHDHPTRSVQPVGLIVDLAQPLLYGAQPAKPALSRFLAPPVPRIHMTRRPTSFLALGSWKKGCQFFSAMASTSAARLGYTRAPMAKYAPSSMTVLKISQRSKSVSPRTRAFRKWRLTRGNTSLRALAAAFEGRAL